MTKKIYTLVICDRYGTEMEYKDFDSVTELKEYVNENGYGFANVQNCYDEDGKFIGTTSYAMVLPSRVYAITNPARMTHYFESPEVCAFPTAEERNEFCAESHGYYIPMLEQPIGFNLYEIIDDYGTAGKEPEYYHWYMTTEPLVDVASNYDDLLSIVEYDTIVE